MNHIDNAKKAATWTIEPMHSSIGFRVRHLMITNVHGQFQNVSGTVVYGATRPEGVEVRAEIDAASIFTNQAQRDAHLRDPDFLDVDRHPTIAFRSTRVRVSREAKGDAPKLEVIGDLTIRGTTREVSLAVAEVTREQKDHNGRTRIGVSATAKIKRSDFGITYNILLEAGGVALSDEIAVRLDVSLVKAAS